MKGQDEAMMSSYHGEFWTSRAREGAGGPTDPVFQQRVQALIRPVQRHEPVLQRRRRQLRDALRRPSPGPSDDKAFGIRIAPHDSPSDFRAIGFCYRMTGTRYIRPTEN